MNFLNASVLVAEAAEALRRAADAERSYWVRDGAVGASVHRNLNAAWKNMNAALALYREAKRRELATDGKQETARDDKPADTANRVHSGCNDEEVRRFLEGARSDIAAVEERRRNAECEALESDHETR